MTTKSPGQIAYEIDVERQPLYGDGSKRRTWDQLPDFAKRTWEHNPTPRTYRVHYPDWKEQA